MSGSTIKDVAAAAGVSIATVSRVIHRHPSVAAELRGRVEGAMRKLGYEPNAAAQTIRTRTSKMIACAIRDSSIPEFAAFTRAAEAVVREAGYTLMLTNTGEEPAQELELVKVLGSRRIDGLMLTKSEDRNEAVEAALDKLGIPVVFIDRYPSLIGDTVAIDHQYGIRLAIDHLVSLGHERIALVTGRPSMRPARERLLAYEAGMRAHGLAIDPMLVQARSFYAEQSFHYLSLLLHDERLPTAIIAGGMSLLSPVLRAVRMRGLTVGEDISIVAGCDSELAELTTPAITAIRWDVRAWGRRAANLLLDHLRDPAEVPYGRQITLPTELVIRGSCRRPR